MKASGSFGTRFCPEVQSRTESPDIRRLDPDRRTDRTWGRFYETV
jgi:hypothetical protein